MTTRLPCPIHGYHAMSTDMNNEQSQIPIGTPPRVLPLPVLIPDSPKKCQSPTHGSPRRRRACCTRPMAWSTQHFLEEQNVKNGEERVRLAIQHAVDNALNTIDLSASFSSPDHEKIKTLPAEIGELRYLTVLPDLSRGTDDLAHRGCVSNHIDSVETAGLQIFLGFNLLSELPLEFYDLHNLTVLGLQNNRITELSFRIGQLKSLQRLNIGGNRLEVVPGEILLLPKLQQFTVRPNPLRTPPSQSCDVFSDKGFVYTLPNWLRALGIPVQCLRIEMMQTLLEISARCALAHKEDLRLIRHRLSERFRSMLDEAMHRRCIVCGTYFLRASVKLIVWLDYLGSKDIPFLLRFCSVKCLEQPNDLPKLLARHHSRSRRPDHGVDERTQRT